MPLSHVSAISRVSSIIRVDAIPVSLPLIKPVLMGAGQRFTHSDSLLVRIECDDGIVGWGEASAAPSMTGESLPDMVGAVREYLAPLLLGQSAIERPMVERAMHRARPANSGSRAACDIALYDVLGKLFGCPVYALLGGAARHEVPVVHLLANATVQEDLSEAKTLYAEGTRYFKVKVGVKPAHEEQAECAMLRALLGAEAFLCADANMGMELPAAIAYARAAAAAGFAFLEQPLDRDDLAGALALGSSSGLALCADESIHDIDSIVQWQRADAIGGVNLKTIKLGGLGGAQRAAIVADQLGLRVNLAAKAGESSIGCAALAHLACAIPNIDWGVTPSSQYLSADTVRKPLRPELGRVRLPEGVGLGVDVDEVTVERYRCKSLG